MPQTGFPPPKTSILSFTYSCNFFLFIILFLSGCSTLKVEKAFNGEFSRAKNNKIINNYCQNCHVHKYFQPKEHILKKRRSYKKKIYSKTSDCRTCHYLEKIWSRNDLRRKTRYPSLVGKGFFLDFENKEKKRKKN